MDSFSPRQATAFPLAPEIVESCIADTPADHLFSTAFREGLHRLPKGLRGGALSGVTGHIAESVAELLLDDLGYTAIWHFAGPGRHGVDLLELGPGGNGVVAVEVKGTLRPRRWPGLTRKELLQMSPDWLDKSDNPGMDNWGLSSEDIYGAVILINFADRRWKAGLSDDLRSFRSVQTLDDLTDWIPE